MRQSSSAAKIVPRLVVVEKTVSSLSDFLRLAPAEMAAMVRNNHRVPTTFLERLRAFIMLGRPRTCIPGLLCYNLGHYYTGEPFSGRILLGELLAFLIGFAANIQNTYSDIEEDSHNLPGRLYLVLQLGYRNLLAASIGLACFMLLGAALIQLNLFLFMILAILGTFAYSFNSVGHDRAKERPILGLWVFSQAVAFPFAFGWLAEPDKLFLAGMSPLLWVLFKFPLASDQLIFQGFRYLGMLIFVTLWFMAKGTFKNVPDFYGDLAAGIRTSATICKTWKRAAGVSATVTAAAYLCLGVLVGLGLEPPRMLFALVWLIPVTWNGFSLIAAESGAKGNHCLKRDMVLSSGFIATVLALEDPRWQNWAIVAVAALILFGSDFLGIDSRRQKDVPLIVRKSGASS